MKPKIPLSFKIALGAFVILGCILAVSIYYLFG